MRRRVNLQQILCSGQRDLRRHECFPFNNDGLEELALDPQILKDSREAAGGHRRDARIVQLAYLASKRRTKDALTDSRQKSFGIREEHRMSWDLFQGLKSRLRCEVESDAGVELFDCPAHAWPVKTSVYLDYLWRLVDEFLTSFEVVRPNVVTISSHGNRQR